MNIYWFSDKDGHYWIVIVANNKQEAWKILAHQDEDEKTVKELQEEYELVQRTVIGKKSGVIATIYPLEVKFYLEEKPETD